MEHEPRQPRSRREFIATGAAAATAVSALPFVRTGEAREAPLKVGVVGTGGRGTGACANALVADAAVELVGMADIAPDRITWSLDRLRNHRDLQDEAFQKRIKITEDTTFSGTGAYKELMAMELDYVILTAPPGFRPLHFAEAVERGLHVFAEKPLATDPTGCRSIRGTAQEARRKGLSVVVGLNYRHDLGTMELVKRVHDGAVGEIVAGSMHRMGGSLWHRGSYPQWTPLEYKIFSKWCGEN